MTSYVKGKHSNFQLVGCHMYKIQEFLQTKPFVTVLTNTILHMRVSELVEI